MADTKTRKFGRWLALTGLSLAVLCVLAAMVSGLGYRIGWWHFRAGFLVLRVAFYAALAAAALSLLGLIVSRGARGALAVGLAGIIVALGFAYIPWQWKRTADALPYIHDISTDVDNPPQFVAAAKLRKEGDHPVAHDGPEVAAKQKEAYPDLTPLTVNAPREKVFEAAQAAIGAMKLTLTDASPMEGRLEASHTSFWYGFTDDMVVRITEAPDGIRVDVRSKSRVGRSDLGQNAKRIRTFLAKFKQELG